MGALDYRDKILALIDQKPVQPTEVAKELRNDSMLASAMLAEMSSKGLLKVSHLKVGSSPLYYHVDHPEHLLNYISYLNDKDRKTVALLQTNGILRDQAQDPLTRVSLRNVKDFAKPLEVSIDGVKEMFWKFFTLTDEEAATKIKQLLEPPKVEPPAPKVEQPAPRVEKPKKPRKPRAKKANPVPQQTLQAPEEPKPAEAPKEELPAIDIDDPFLQKLLSFFKTSNITVLEQIAIKKKSEYDFVVQLESPVGKLHYYCKAKSKAKIGESDLSHAFVQGQLKKLPILFLTPGSLTKPAQELIKQLKGLTVKQV